MERTKFRANLDILSIEVNDNGDTINVPLSDERFNQKLLTFAENASKSAQELTDTDLTTDEIFEKNMEFNKYIREQFDILFGKGSYDKVYGGMLVSADHTIDFIELILPSVQKSNENKIARMSKYSADRVGSSN